MNYLIFAEQDEEEEPVAMCRKVQKQDQVYLKDVVIPKLKPLTDDEYLYGPAGIVRTPAKSSYVIDGTEVYWCIDWEPGLLVIRFSPDGSLHWAAFKSLDDDEADESDPQYNLVYEAWDAQFDEDVREEDWEDAPEKLTEIHEAALGHVNELHERLEAGFNKQKDVDAYFERCEKSPIWKGTVAMG